MLQLLNNVFKNLRLSKLEKDISRFKICNVNQQLAYLIMKTYVCTEVQGEVVQIVSRLSCLWKG